GGFLGRKGDGEPGVKTLWLGLQRFKDITSTWVMTRELQIEEVI
ncbi:MAG: IS4 family transposase, partial [Spirulinaceae cyanobacterium]